MNALIYRTGYATLGVVRKIGHRVPKNVIVWCILHTPDEINTLRLYRAGRIDGDGFDLRVDWHCALWSAYEKKGN